MKELILYKDNNKNVMYVVKIEEVIKGYIDSSYRTIDWPFERKFTRFISENYTDSTYEPFNEEQWFSIWNQYTKLRVQY